MTVVTAQELAGIQGELDSLRGATAVWWTYTVSHGVLEIRLLRAGFVENTHLVCEGCGWLAGPAGWTDANLVVSLNDDPGRRGALAIEDRRVGFFVTCGLIRFAHDVAPLH